jgi:N-methylhydantoinase B
MQNHSPDPITLEVVRNAVLSIAEEMAVIMMRSARAPLLKESGDLSCALTDAAGRLIAQGKDIPIHLGVMAFTVKEFLKWVAPRGLQPGDVYFTNLKEVGGNHLPDVKAIRPVFHGGRLVAFAINLAHWSDIGGATAGSYHPIATEIYQEGLQIPPLRLFDAGGVDRTCLELILRNVRGRDEREGDIFAQYATNAVAAERLGEVFDAHGRDAALACFDRFLAESEQQMRGAIRALPDGSYLGEDLLDDDGLGSGPIPIRVAVQVRGDEIAFDFTGTSPQVRGPVNTTAFATCSAVFYACKTLLGPDVAPNDGAYRCIQVHAPAGTILNAGPEAPVVGGNHETTQRVVDAIFRALAPILPERIGAAGPATSGLTLFTGRRADGNVFLFYEPHGGGEGATGWRDGTNAVRVHMSNVMNTPIEVAETEYPLRIEAYALRPGSAGAGRFRGGLGMRRAYRILGEEAQVTTMLERAVVPPWGLAGGKPGAPFRITLERGGTARPVRGKETVALRRGDLLVLETCGGGGVGPPEERDPALTEADHAAGYL